MATSSSTMPKSAERAISDSRTCRRNKYRPSASPCVRIATGETEGTQGRRGAVGQAQGAARGAWGMSPHPVGPQGQTLGSVAEG